MEFDREDVFKKIQKKDWHELIELFKNNSFYNSLMADEIVRNVVNQNFVEELISGGSFKTDSAYLFYLSQFFILHKSNKFEF